MAMPPKTTHSDVDRDRSADLPPVWTEERRQALANLIASWVNAGPEEAEEQRETLDYLIRVLDEDRLSDRKLFS